MSERRRRRTKSSHTDTVADQPSYLTRTAPTYDILNEEQITAIEAAAEDILHNIGVQVSHEPSLQLLRAAGCNVEGERVTFERGFCRKLITENAPSEFTQHARNPAKSVRIGGNSLVMVPVYGPPFVAATDIERRYGTLEDFNTFVKLAHMAPEMHHTGGPICEPTDVPVSKRHLDMNYGHLALSDKCFMGAVTEKSRAEDTMRMCEIAFGKDFVDQNCVVSALINLNSPLVLDETMLDAAHVYAAAGQACVIAPFMIAGASSPTTVAGSAAQALAETLVGMALTQLIRPGAPVIYGFMMLGMSMKSGSPIRYDETWKSLLIAGQLARRLGVPFRCGGSSSNSKIPDAQAGWEGALYMMFSMLAGVNFFIHATGTLEAGLVANFDKFLIDCDMLGAAARMMTEVDTSPNALALDAIAEIGPAGNFLTAAHTMERYKTAFYVPSNANGDSFEQWNAEGSMDAAERAMHRRKQMLSEYQRPPMDPEVDAALIEFISRRKAALPDTFA
ncbi:trimethylamine methyltransferase family protein [Cochlodiniinecator piscidefendens]|uniref:trimethylamine methyltransferase family protein n=1 Tax=Cochlodiniinecator piscidefendens TaxID=2715756 RepID=UPI00140BAE2D|nr:trimethylamine methyltransferase family protein [Cochlodiniinecator piscidefendens]